MLFILIPYDVYMPLNLPLLPPDPVGTLCVVTAIVHNIFAEIVWEYRKRQRPKGHAFPLPACGRNFYLHKQNSILSNFLPDAQKMPEDVYRQGT